MIHLTIPANDRKKLGQERFQHPQVQQKMEVLYLMGMGLSRHDVAEGAVRS